MRIMRASAVAVLTATAGIGCNTPNTPTQVPFDPNATFTVSGRVTEPGSGMPIQGVAVTLAPCWVSSPPVSATTDATGMYQVTNVAPAGLCLNLAKPGFEDQQRVLHLSTDLAVNIRMQPRLEMSSDDTLQSIVYEDDAYYVDFTGEAVCEPCRLIHVTIPRPGVLELRLVLSARPPRPGLVFESRGGNHYLGCCQPEIHGAYAVEPGEVVLKVTGSRLASDPFEIVTALR
jgi:hypothetical protein